MLAKEREALEKFELANERIKGLISDYQLGRISFPLFVSSLLREHSVIRSCLEGFSSPLAPLLTKLEISLSKILSGDERYVATVPDCYHNILFQLHHLWVEHLQRSGRPYKLGYVCGWDFEIPPEVDFALSHLPESLAIERKDGWMIFSKTGVLENHYCILRREGEKILLEYSDEDLPRARAVSQVLGEMGMRWEMREMSWIGERRITNRIIGAEGPYDGEKVRSLVALLRASRCLDLLLLDVNRGEEELPENLQQRSEVLQREILAWCTRHPERCNVDWATVAVRADLAPLIRKGTLEEAREMIRKILKIAERVESMEDLICTLESWHERRAERG
jgi:hypothetical protein